SGRADNCLTVTGIISGGHSHLDAWQGVPPWHSRARPQCDAVVRVRGDGRRGALKSMIPNTDEQALFAAGPRLTAPEQPTVKAVASALKILQRFVTSGG